MKLEITKVTNGFIITKETGETLVFGSWTAIGDWFTQNLEIKPTHPTHKIEYTIKEAAKIIGISPDSVYQATSRKKLPVILKDGKKFITNVAVSEYIKYRTDKKSNAQKTI